MIDPITSGFGAEHALWLDLDLLLTLQLIPWVTLSVLLHMSNLLYYIYIKYLHLENLNEIS